MRKNPICFHGTWKTCLMAVNLKGTTSIYMALFLLLEDIESFAKEKAMTKKTKRSIITVTVLNLELAKPDWKKC